MVGVVAEVLMLKIVEAAGKEAGSAEQNNREGGLHDDKGFLGPGGVIAGAAIGAAERFSRDRRGWQARRGRFQR